MYKKQQPKKKLL